MIIKKFTANSEQDAIKMAKNDLGKDAIVMNIKKIKAKGLFKLFMKTKFEITAAIDENNSYANVQLEKAEDHKPILSSAKDDKKKSEVEISDTTAIERKLDSLQELIAKRILAQNQEEIKQGARKETIDEQQEKKERELSKIETCKKLIYDQLIQNEVDEKYAKKLMDEIQNSITADSSIDVVLGNVYQKIILKLGQPKEIEIAEGMTKFIFFIGPTGVGKTTTIAKISSDLKLNKKANIALVTADTYRIAAVEQLKTYANILGVPLKVIYSSPELKELVNELREYEIVLVDTAGHSHLSREHTEELRDLLNSVDKDEREVYLVLSATTKYKDLRGITESYDNIVDYNLIFTKLDETTCIGNLYNIKVMTNAPMSYTTCGQNVPDDIGTIDPQKIAKQLLGGNT